MNCKQGRASSRSTLGVLAPALLMTMTWVGVRAQSSQATTPASGPVLQLSPAAQMRALEPAADEEYTLGGGDEISVDVPGHPELSGKHIVGPDGRISLPQAGTVNLGGLTREQASAAVEAALGKYYKDIAASLSIDHYGSNRVLVLGAVVHPGPLLFDQTPTLLEAITRAGILPASGLPNATGVAVAKASGGNLGMPAECKIYRGAGDQQQVVSINLHQLLASGNPMADMRLRRNDIVFVPNPHDRFVSVLGQVGHPGSVMLTDQMNLPAVISEAGGLTEYAGNNPTIAVADPATKKTRYIKYKDLVTPEGMNEVALKPGDLIFVPKSGLSKVGFVFQQIGPMTALASIAAVAVF